VLQCVVVCCSVLQCVAVCCSVLQCVAMRLHCVAVMVQCQDIHSSFLLDYVSIYEFQYAAVCCSALQCVAACCSVLQ